MTVSHKRRPLTGTERVALSLLAQGLRNKEAADRMGLTRVALENAVKRARRALGAENAVHAVYLALTSHQIPPEPCGSVPAYQWHLRRGDHPCAECRAAWALKSRQQRAAATARRNAHPAT